jgi:hypothetical protein
MKHHIKVASLGAPSITPLVYHEHKYVIPTRSMGVRLSWLADAYKNCPKDADYYLVADAETDDGVPIIAMEIAGYREETDEEYDARIKKETERAAAYCKQVYEAEYQAYLNLKAKFEVSP